MSKPTALVKNRSNSKIYDRVALVLRKDGRINKEAVQSRADSLGLSVNGYISQLIDKDMNADG